MRVAEDGGEAVAQRAAAARVASGAAAFLLRAEDARRQGVRRKEKAPPLPLL